MAKAVNPIKAIKGGVQQVKASVTAVKINNQNVKNGTGARAIGAPAPTKQTIGPGNIVKAFVAGAKNPAAAKQAAAQMKTIKKAQGR